MLACRGNLQKIYLALSFYANDNRGTFPIRAGATRSEAPLSLLVPRSTTETSIFICPGSDDKPIAESEPFDRRQISYAYYMGWSTAEGGGKAIVTDWQVEYGSQRGGPANLLGGWEAAGQ